MTNEKIQKLVSQNEKISIDDVEFEINPLTVNDFLKAQMIGQNKDQGRALLQMMTDSLKNEDIDKQGLKEAPAKLLKHLQDAITEINDFEDFFSEDEKQEALEKLQ